MYWEQGLMIEDVVASVLDCARVEEKGGAIVVVLGVLLLMRVKWFFDAHLEQLDSLGVVHT